MPDEAVVDGGRAATIEDAVKIMPLGGRKTGVKIMCRHLRFQHHHGLRPEEMIEGIAHLVGRELLLQVEMRHLALGMDSRIGAARARDGDPQAGEFLDRLFQRALHRGAIVLALPADKGTSVIFHGKAIARHQVKRTPLGSAKPLSNSWAAIALPPARCTLSNRSAPSPQAMVRSSPMISPIGPFPS